MDTVASPPMPVRSTVRPPATSLVCACRDWIACVVARPAPAIQHHHHHNHHHHTPRPQWHTEHTSQKCFLITTYVPSSSPPIDCCSTFCGRPLLQFISTAARSRKRTRQTGGTTTFGPSSSPSPRVRGLGGRGRMTSGHSNSREGLQDGSVSTCKVSSRNWISFCSQMHKRRCYVTLPITHQTVQSM